MHLAGPHNGPLLGLQVIIMEATPPNCSDEGCDLYKTNGYMPVVRWFEYDVTITDNDNEITPPARTSPSGNP